MTASHPNSYICTIFEEADVRIRIDHEAPVTLVVDPDCVATAERCVERHSLSPNVQVRASTADMGDLEVGQVVWVLSMTRETRLVERLNRDTRATVWGFFDDVYPDACAGEAPPESGHGIEELTAYAIICTPRSGSSYLAELLTLNGAGRPKEHLRPPLVALARTDEAMRACLKLFSEFIERGQADGVFGTKIVSEFMLAVEDEVDAAVLKAQLDRFKHFFIVHLVRKDLVRQALSFVRAEQTGIWHIRRCEEEVASAEADFTYDFDAIQERCMTLLAEEEIVLRVVRNAPFPVVTVIYEELVADPWRVMASIFDHLPNGPKGSVDTRIKAISDPVTDKFAARFRRACEFLPGAR